ncbi:MAG: DUF3014 domain-containing protein [Hyalangium sp.]|uniref:DUF3014 domain-containing protein n=1 Tax=Hyalangium sp. TaxID=2028555 RepID=UPI00389B153E
MSDPQPSPPSRKPLYGAIVALVVAGAAGVGAYVLRGRSTSTPPTATPTAPSATATNPQPSGRTKEVTGAKPLPSVDQSDTRTRELVGLLSNEPELKKWVAAEGLARRFTAAVANIAEGESPRAVLPSMAPQGAFQTVERDGKHFIAPESFARYDSVGRIFNSLDTEITVNTYKALRPIFEQAFAEIARPGQRFDETLSRAIQRMLDTPVPDGDIEVVATQGVNYAYADPKLEQLSAAQKHLLRLGPTNAKAVQAKLRELQTALGLPAAGH